MRLWATIFGFECCLLLTMAGCRTSADQNLEDAQLNVHKDERAKISKIGSQGLLFGDAPKYLWPVTGKVTSHFGKRSRGHHQGLDIAAPRGTPVRSAWHGRVVEAGWQRGYGKTVVISHGSLKSLYAHCSRILVKSGDEVSRGQVIALVGSSGRSSGPHLHFEVRSPRWTALNPLDYLPL